MEFQVANVVGMITYQQELDLAALAETFSKREEITQVTYEPAENHWLQTRFAPDDTYVAFYRSGRCSIAGCASIGDFESAVVNVNGVMADLLSFEYEPEVAVSNIVATLDLGAAIRLEVAMVELGMNQTEYEPEQFPALMYRAPDYVMLIFSSGKLLCTGLTDLDAVSKAFDDVASRLQALA